MPHINNPIQPAIRILGRKPLAVGTDTGDRLLMRSSMGTWFRPRTGWLEAFFSDVVADFHLYLFYFEWNACFFCGIYEIHVNPKSHVTVLDLRVEYKHDLEYNFHRHKETHHHVHICHIQYS